MSQATESDEAVLFPEQTLTIGGQDVTVREFTFLEGLHLERIVRPIIEDMEAAGSAESGGDGLDVFSNLLADHSDTMIKLVAQAADVSEDFVRGLSDADGQSLMLTFWGVNGNFFLRRLVMRRMAAEAQANDLDQAQAGAESSQPSSDTATTGKTSSDAPPSAS